MTPPADRDRIGAVFREVLREYLDTPAGAALVRDPLAETGGRP